MRLEDFNYALPEELIAQTPAARRDASRLMVYDRVSKELKHQHFADLTGLLRSGDTLVVNNTKVIPARLNALDEKERAVEVFLLKRLDSTFLRWQCLMKPGKRIPENDPSRSLSVKFRTGGQGLIKRSPGESGIFHVEISLPPNETFESWVQKAGEPPLPPYLKRTTKPSDIESYQTVYARELGSVAAPTAGLHFTTSLIEALKAKGVFLEEVTLHVGYGTFSPIRVEHLEDHVMHTESYELSQQAFDRIQANRKNGGRTIAVGTTSLRTLESIQTHGLKGDTQLFIKPGYQFTSVDGLITNFHLPESSLYVLVCALLGLEEAKRCYTAAIQEKYRFFSYGDAMAIL